MDLVYAAWRARGQRATGLYKVHRIDKVTSGLLAYARTELAERALYNLFRAHDIERSYRFVAHGQVAARTLDQNMVKDRGDGLRWVTTCTVPSCIRTRSGTPIFLGGLSKPRHAGHRLRDWGGRQLHELLRGGLMLAFRARWRRLGMKGGVLLANPIPEAAALDRAEIDAAIEAALAAASAGGVKGKALTPFLLAELARTTGARSVVANRALAVHNCSVAGAVASELGKLALLAKKAKLSR